LFVDGQKGDPDSARASALAVELRVLFSKVSRRLREQAHPGDFTSAQKSVLLRLERDGPATVTTLARAESVRPQSLGATVSTLQSVGLVVGTPDPADGRQTILSLTDSCREMIQASRAAKEDWLFRMIQNNLTSGEQDELSAAVELLKRLFDS
jgi:DNA-binding MarR family transcriptional regulator